MSAPPTPRWKTALAFVLLFASALAVYVSTTYGGIRSPDGEVVYLTAQSISRLTGTHAQLGLPLWPGFGVARGRDGKLYSIFGPVQSLVAAPLVSLARSIDRTDWYRSAPFPIPLSYLQDRTLSTLRRPGAQPTNLEPHAERFLVSLLNTLVTSASVVVFGALLLRLGVTPVGTGITAVLYAFGSLAWPYAGTFFSEPLASLWALLSLLLLLPRRNHATANRLPGFAALAFSGLFLGLGLGTHLTAVLFAPFFAACAAGYPYVATRSARRAGTALAYWALGLLPVLMALAWYNYYRFGNVLETGRYVSQFDRFKFAYGSFVFPLPNLLYLLASPGKGLLLLCPAVVLGALGWSALRRRDPLLAWGLAGAAGLRLLFIAARSDWDGGFGLGPRYLLMLVPFLLVPAGFVADAVLAARARLPLAALLAGLAACCAQQLAFSIGEIFLYYYRVCDAYAARGFNIMNDRLYTDWSFSPLLHILAAPRAPFLWQRVPADNVTLWLSGTALIVLGAAAFFAWTCWHAPHLGTGVKPSRDE